MLTIKKIPTPGYHTVLEATDPEHNFHCFVAIHDCTLGPSLGGLRIYPYENKEDALKDALRLAKAMTYKSAICEDGLGGGKSVIISHKDYSEATKELHLQIFARVLDSLKGQYIAAEDIGTSPEDMEVLRKITPYVAALCSEHSSGDPSRFTAWGVLRGIHASAQHMWDSSDLRGKKIFIQGLGHVGAKLAQFLFWEGADLILTDTNPTRLHREAMLTGAKTVAPEDFASVDCDIFAPCAMGGVINEETIDKFQCKIIAGGANNQLANGELGNELKKRGILYAPDFIINSGGIINAAAEFNPGGYHPVESRERVNKIYDTLLEVFAMSESEGKATSVVADTLAEYKLKHEIGKRVHPIHFGVALQ